MKLIILISLFSTNVLAYNYSDTVPGKNYTYGEYLMNRSLINRFRAEDSKDSLKGEGIEFFGDITIKTENSLDSEGKKIEKKKYSVYVRNCGVIEVPEKDEKTMESLKSGTRIRMYLIGSTCKISDWEKF